MEDGSYRSQAHNRISATGFTRSPGTWIWSRVLLLQNIFPPSERPTESRLFCSESLWYHPQTKHAGDAMNLHPPHPRAVLDSVGFR